MQTVGCEQFDQGASPTIPIETVFILEQASRSSLEDWEGGIGCR
jgi:hypothetical protein